jgi:hypothetical protein
MKSIRHPRYARHRFPPEVISHAVWLYFRFPLSLRMVEEMLAARGIEVSHETVRQWAISISDLDPVGIDPGRRISHRPTTRSGVSKMPMPLEEPGLNLQACTSSPWLLPQGRHAIPAP